MYDVYKKQLKSVGCPDWTMTRDLPQDSIPHIRVHVMVSDGGPDQQGCKTRIIEACRADLRKWFLSYVCLDHRLHCINKKQLKTLDTHYPSLARIVNTWRSSGNAKKVQESYTEKYGPEAAKVVSRLPPRPLRGRWGSIDGTEHYLIKVGRDKLPIVFDEALLRKVDPKVWFAMRFPNLTASQVCRWRKQIRLLQFEVGFV